MRLSASVPICQRSSSLPSAPANRRPNHFALDDIQEAYDLFSEQRDGVLKVALYPDRWRMPLHKGYERMLKAQIADLTNAPSGGMAGAITAALFLKRFVSPGRRWAHFDIFGWSPTERAHSPVGGEAQAIRAIYRYLQSGAD